MKKRLLFRCVVTLLIITGLVFTGEYMPRIEKILPVKEIISTLVTEAEAVI